MAGKAGHRRFGSVRKLASGRWQARYLGPDGLTRTAPTTYERKRDAELFLSKVETDLARDDWYDPTAGKVKLGPWGRAWLTEHPDLAKTTYERYEIAFRRYIVPRFGNVPVNEIREADVRNWYADLLRTGAGRASVAKAYRVLRAMLNTALDDGMIKRNPCRISGAGDDKSEERPVLSFDEVLRVVTALPPPVPDDGLPGDVHEPAVRRVGGVDAAQHRHLDRLRDRAPESGTTQQR
jgi:Phage integrase, N-terminal SAM-like domain